MGIINKIISKIQDKKAQQMVEMAIVLPVICLCMGVVITCGQLVFAKLTCQLAAFEGARTAVVISDYNQAMTAAKQKSDDIMTNGIGIKDTSVSYSSTGWTKGQHLTYNVQAEVKTLFPVFGADFRPTTLSKVSGHIVMMVERN